MSSVPFLYVNLIALCSFFLFFVTFLAAKKTPEIRAFLVVMLGFVFWTGGSILMRLQVFPGVTFWYYVSILSLFSLAVLIYFFVCSFVQTKGYFLKLVWSVTTLALLLVTARGLILAPPSVDTLPDGGVVFRYTMHWPVVIPFIYFAAIVVSIIHLFRKALKERGRAPGIVEIILGCAAVTLGNLFQLIPGNVFPWDTLSGIVFAALIILALYKKRMFRMTLLVSRSILLLGCALICVCAAAFFIGPLQTFLAASYKLSSTTVTTVIAIAFAVALSMLYMLMKRLVDAMFTREEQQGKILKRFSSEVSQSLDTGDIAKRLASIIKSEIPVCRVYVCLPENGGFRVRYGSEPLDRTDLVIGAANPCVRCLQAGESYLIMDEFRSDPLYLSAWQSEKDVLRQYAVSCVAAMKDGDGIVGLVLLSGHDKPARYTYPETSFLETVVSIASIAVKNAGLYEQMYREARLDSLTGAYNYRCFREMLDKRFEEAAGDNLALLYADLDDFKLYNQLYGSSEGDKILCGTAEAIRLCVGTSGDVFRCSGKVFAALLPGFDGHRSEALANEIHRRIGELNPADSRFKKVTVSCGICISPHAASSPKELMNNADLAVYNAKSSGKDCVCFFKGAETADRRSPSERALTIIEHAREHDTAYQANSSMIYALTAAIDAKDHYTYKHSHNVAMYASILAAAAGFNDEQVSMIYEAALLHDIGKISIPESILGKTGRLTPEEYEIMKGHVTSAIEMIRFLPSMDYVIPAAVAHHERWDGAGYPSGLAGTAIPISGRCLALADAYDAMTTDRPYHKGLSPEFAAEQIEQSSGKQFDPALTRIFVALIRTGELKLKDS